VLVGAPNPALVRSAGAAAQLQAVGRELQQKAELKRECVGISMKQAGLPGHFMEK